jgi:spermidine/putrescine transport system substrate-binding protein
MQGHSEYGVVEIPGRAGMSRSRFLAATGIGALALAGVGAAGEAASALAAGGGSVNLWTWAGYFAPQNLKGFTKSTGTKVNQANYPSNDLMFAKLNSASASSYDIAIPTSGWIPLLVQRGALAELDKARVPLQYVSSSLKGLNYDPHNQWSVPKDYGVFGVLYDPAKVKYPIKSWQDYLDAGAKPGISGAVAASNTADELLGIGMWSLGIDWNTSDTAKIKKAAAVMKAFAKHVKAYASAPIDGMVSGEFVMAVMSHGDARAARLQKPSLKFVVPTPASEIWVDSYVITKKAPNVDNAYAFISYELQPAHQVADTAYIGYPTVLPGLAHKLPASVKLKQDIFIPPSVLERTSSRLTNPKTQGLVAQLYTEITGAS